MKIIRTVFQGPDKIDPNPRFIIVLDMEDHIDFSTSAIPELIHKMEFALPGIFPTEDSPFLHNCGGEGTEVQTHSFRDEIERGTNIAHLYEHILLHLLSRRQKACSAFCGQRAIDIEQGITTHYYLVLNYPSKIEAVVAADLGFQLVSAWVEGQTVTINPSELLDGIKRMIEPMVA